MTREKFIQIIKASQAPYNNNFSHIYGSDYYTVNGFAIRIADHAKHENSFGFENYNKGNDFRNYSDALNYLKSRVDLSDKTKAQKTFASKNKDKIQSVGEYFKTPSGRLFDCIDNALNAMWHEYLETVFKN